MTNQKRKFAEFDPLQDLIDNTSEVVMMLSPDLKFQFVNKAFRETYGFSSEEVIGMSLLDIIHPNSKEEVIAKLELVKSGKIVSDFMMITRNKELIRVYLEGEITCRFENGKAINFRCLFRDVTQRRRAERAQDLYYSIAQANLRTQDLKEFLELVHEELKKKIYANNFFVAIYEPEDGTIYFPYRVDEQYPTPLEDRRKLGNGIVEYALVQNKPLLFYKDEFQELLDKEKIFLYGKEIPEVQVIVPLKVNDKTTGVIGIKSYSDATKFSGQNLELLEFVSGQVALALVRKKAQEDLLLQTSRLNAVFDSSSHFIWTVNAKRHLSSFNKNYAKLIEDQLHEPPLINVSTEKVGWRLISPNDKPLLREMYNLAFEGKPQYFELHWGAIDGGEDWYEFYLNPILSTDTGKISEVSGIARNVTEKKNAILSIQKSEEKFRNIIESFIDIYYRTDLAGNITMISPSVLEHTGYALEEVMGNKVDKFFENALDSQSDIKLLLKKGSITNFDVTVKRKDGGLRQFMLNIRLIKDKKGFPFAVEGIARDITELKNNANDLQKAKTEAEHSLAVKERFLANMSHEIRTPMNGIIGMIDVLNETPLKAEQKDYVNTIKKSSQILLAILNDILDLSKIEAGKMDLHLVDFEMEEILKTLIALFNQKAFEKGNTITYLIDKNVPKYFLADQTRILQILSNLTSNAIKFTQNGEIKIVLSLLNKSSAETELKFEIIDQGIGISEEDQLKLFNAFQQLDNSTSKSFGGTGLGLVISRELSQRMNGEMGVYSKIGEGSNFWFTCKLKIGKKTSKNKDENEGIVLTNYFTKLSPKILLVDDNAINRKVAKEILKRAGCQIIEAESGQIALDNFTNSPDFDLILMDIQMPLMDGIETTRILRERFAEKLPKVVAMTAYSMQDDKEKFLNSGFDGYVSKPIRAEILVKTVEKMLGSKEVKPSKKKTENPFSKTPSFDWNIINSLKEMVGADMLTSVFEDFKNEAEEQLDKTAAAFQVNDIKTIQQELHTLKGNSGTIGLMKIYKMVKEIEVPAKEGSLEAFEEKFKALRKEFDTTKKEFYLL
jgi:PAS domain S-box-containing protein